MTTVRFRISLAMMVALGLAQGCSTQPPKDNASTTTETVAEPAVAVEPTKSPFPPPVIEIGSDDDPLTAEIKSVIYWKKDAYRLNSASETETNGRLSDELTWRIKHFTVVDSSGKDQEEVEWASIHDGPTEQALIWRVGGQFHWKVAGTTPEICSWYNVTTEVPACVHDGSPLGFTGIPKSLFEFVPTLRARFKKDTTWVEEEVKVIKLQGDTCK